MNIKRPIQINSPFGVVTSMAFFLGELCIKNLSSQAISG